MLLAVDFTPDSTSVSHRKITTPPGLRRPTISGNDKAALEDAPIGQMNRGSVSVVSLDLAVEPRLDAQCHGLLVEGHVQVGPVHHIVRGFVVGVQVGRQVGEPDYCAALPSPKVDLGGLDDLLGEAFRDAPSRQKLA